MKILLLILTNINWYYAGFRVFVMAKWLFLEKNSVITLLFIKIHMVIYVILECWKYTNLSANCCFHLKNTSFSVKPKCLITTEKLNTPLVSTKKICKYVTYTLPAYMKLLNIFFQKRFCRFSKLTWHLVRNIETKWNRKALLPPFNFHEKVTNVWRKRTLLCWNRNPNLWTYLWNILNS